MKIDKKYIKIGVITLVGLGVIYGGVKLVRSIRNSNSQTDEETINESNKTEKIDVKKPSFNGDKVVQKGSRGDEVKTIQTAFNNIIEDAKKINLLTLKSDYKPKESKSVSDWFMQPINAQFQLDKLSDKAKRVNKIASIPKLKVDGDFGSKSVKASEIIMGTTSTTYNKVKQKRIDFAKAYGLGNPYGN